MPAPQGERAVMNQRRFQGAGGVTLAADVGGDPGATPVLLLHGGGQTRHSWRNAARELVEAGYQAIALDLRGHGDSDWAPDGDYRLDTQVGDLLAVIGALPSPPVLIGASLGGLVALAAAGEAGAGIARALVLVDVTPRVDPAGEARIIGFMRANPDGFASVEQAGDAIAAYLPHRPRPKDLSGLSRNLRRRPDGRHYWHWDPRFFDTFDTSPGVSERRYTAAAGKLRCPTLLVRGSNSELVNEDSVRHFRALLPQAEYVDVLGAAHMVAGDRNDAFNAAILDFIRRRA